KIGFVLQKPLYEGKPHDRGASAGPTRTSGSVAAKRTAFINAIAAPASPGGLTMPDPWHQLPDEPDDAFAGFLFFVQEGLGRRLLDAYNTHRLAEGKHPLPEGRRAEAAWYAWSIRYRWAERAASYDEKRTDQHSLLTTQAVIQMINLLAEEGI